MEAEPARETAKVEADGPRSNHFPAEDLNKDGGRL